MSSLSWLRNRKRTSPNRSMRAQGSLHKPAAFRPQLETLEGRWLPSTYYPLASHLINDMNGAPHGFALPPLLQGAHQINQVPTLDRLGNWGVPSQPPTAGSVLPGHVLPSGISAPPFSNLPGHALPNVSQLSAWGMPPQAPPAHSLFPSGGLWGPLQKSPPKTTGPAVSMVEDQE